MEGGILDGVKGEGCFVGREVGDSKMEGTDVTLEPVSEGAKLGEQVETTVTSVVGENVDGVGNPVVNI